MAFAKPNLVQPDAVPLAMTPVQRVPPERCKKHPLWELQERVAKEIANGDFDEPENGTWDGRWPTPSEATRRELCRTGNLKNQTVLKNTKGGADEMV